MQMLGYTEEDLDNMIGGVDHAITSFVVEDEIDKEILGWLKMTKTLLQGLPLEGHFSDAE
jgi:hypothetical protein